MKKIICICILLTQFSCKGDPEFYHSRFYPVIKDGANWEVNEIFRDKPVSIQLESRMDYEDHESITEGVFKSIEFEKTILFLDKDIYYLTDTIKKGSNLLNYNIAEIKIHQISRQNSFVDDSYIFWINKDNDMVFNESNRGYYTVYLESITENDFFINDSTIIKIE